MNILQINTADNKGGAAKVAYSLKNGLEKLGHTTSMLVKEKYSTDKNVFLIYQKSKLFKKMSGLSKMLIKKDLPNYIKNKCICLLSNDIDFFNSSHILKTEEFKNADILHCHNLHGNYFNLSLLQKISKIKPIVWTLHDMWTITGHCAWAGKTERKTCDKWQTECCGCPHLKTYQALAWDNSKYLWNKKKKIYQNSKLNIVAPSLWLKEKVKKSILKEQNIILIHYGIDVKKFKKYNKTRARNKLNLPLDKKIIMFSAHKGKNNKQKGWLHAKEIINHYKKNNNILFLCIGGNKEDEQFSSSKLKYIEYIDDKSLLAQYYSASDVFLLTSLAENFPSVILEAMSCGTPIVSFDVGGVKEAIIHKKNGYIAKYQDTNDLIKGIEYIFSLDDGLQKMSRNSIQRAKENFSLDTMTNNYLELYQEILNK